MKRTPLKRKTPMRRGPWKRQKFRAKPVHNLATGQSFDSTSEARYYGLLEIRQRAGEISSLALHPKIVLIEKRGKAPEVAWRCDYSYMEAGRMVYEDWKRPEALWDGRDRLLLRLWAHFGPGLLRITGAKGVMRTVMPEGSAP